jgi:hypothetical protein
MKKIFLALALVLPGCSTLGTLSSPAPLSQTTLDEKTLVVSLQTFDTVLTAIDRLVAAGVIKPGSAKARAIANAIGDAKAFYLAASAAQKVGNARSYYIALSQAQVAVAEINGQLKGN